MLCIQSFTVRSFNFFCHFLLKQVDTFLQLILNEGEGRTDLNNNENELQITSEVKGKR